MPSRPSSLLRASIALALLCAAPAPSRAADPPGFTANRLYVASVSADAVFELGPDGEVLRTLGAGALDAPRGVAFGPDGNLYVADAARVAVLDGTGALIASIGPGSTLTTPRALAFGPKGRLYVSSGDRILIFDQAGQEVGLIGGDGSFGAAAGLAVNAAGHVFVSSGGTNEVLEFDPNGAWIRSLGAGTPLSIPMGLAFGPEGRLYVCSFFGNAVLEFEADGTPTGGSASLSSAGLVFPSGIAVAPSGNFVVTSFATHQLVEFNPGGVVTGSIAPTTDLGSPEGIAFAPRRFSARISGTLARPGLKAKKLKESVVLSIAPGSRVIQVALTDGTSDTDLASVFGAEAFVFHGYEAFGDYSDKTRILVGLDVDAPERDPVVASIPLTVKGAFGVFGAGQAFLPKSASGPLQVAGPAGVLKASLKTKKALN